MDLLELLKGGDIKKVIEQVQSKRKSDVANYAAEYNNDRKQREGQVGKREDKTLVDGKINIVTKIPIPFQRNIVQSDVSFLFGSPVELSEKNNSENSTNEGFLSVINLWDDLRIDSLLKDFSEKVESETESAILLFPVETADKKVKVKARVLSSENGKLYPCLDAFGDMIAFGWGYSTKENDKDVSYMYLWTAEINYVFRKEKDWEPAPVNPKTPNLFQKIPVVYLPKKNTAWWEVQHLIDRYEISVSKLADVNDEHAEPKYILRGKAGLLPNKDTKAISIEIVETKAGNVISGDVDLLEMKDSSQSKKLELDTLEDLIYTMSSTVNFSKLAEGGFGNLSGSAIKLMFLAPRLKAKRNEGDYQIVISRLISLLKSAITNITKDGKGDMDELRIKATFTSILPENLKETIEVLSEAMGGKQLQSSKTTMKHNPFIENVEEEIEQLQEELSKESVSELGATEQI